MFQWSRPRNRQKKHKASRFATAALNAATICAAITLSVALISAAYKSHVFPRRLAAVGSSAEPLHRLKYRDSAITVLFVIDSNCAFCKQSAPAFQAVIAAVQREGRSVKCVVVGSESESTIRSFVDDNHLSAEIDTLSEDAPLARVVPRTRVVTRDGILRAEWLGKLETNRGLEVAQAVSRLMAQ